MSVAENKEFTYIWKIENFSMLPHQNGEVLMSPEFAIDMWEGIKWHLELYPRGNKTDEDEIVFYFHATVTEMTDLDINFSLTLEANNPANEMTWKTVYKLQKLGIGWDLCSLTEIYSKKNLYLPQDILSLRCHFSPIEANNVELTVNNELESATNLLKKVYISRSAVQVQQMSFTWPIYNISTRGERVETSFTMNDSPELKVTLNFSEVPNNVCVPIEIQQTAPAPLHEEQERLFVKCKMTVDSVFEEYRDSKESTHLFKLYPNDVWHFPLFIKITNLTRDKYLNQKDTLLLQCEFAFSYENGVYNLDDNPFPIGSKNKHETSTWCNSVQNLCASGKFSDVKIKAGGETFPAHKLVLSARSSVFSAMFENDMKEKISGVVEIDDVDPSTLKTMLTFIHSDDIEEEGLSSEDVCKLYAAAEKYNIESLKGWCTKSLMSTLSVESVYDVLDIADTNCDNFLMTSACNFMCCQEAEYFDSLDWLDFMDTNPKLSAKVMQQVLVNKKRI